MFRIKPRSRPVVDTLEERVVLSTVPILPQSTAAPAAVATTRTLPKIPVETTATPAPVTPPVSTTRTLSKIHALSATAPSTISVPTTTIRSLSTMSNRGSSIQAGPNTTVKAGPNTTVKLSRMRAFAVQAQANRSNLPAATTRVSSANAAGRQATSFKVGIHSSSFTAAATDGASATARLPVAITVARLGR